MLQRLLALASLAAARNESYAVLVYGDGGAALGALVLGSVLRRADPARSRVALVAGIPEATRDALATAWDVREAVAFSEFGVDPLEAGAWPGRKLDLWRLPFERVLYLDADIIPLEHPRLRQQLDRVFGSLGAAPIAALESRPGCFNGGFLLVRPGATERARYAAAVAGARRNAACEGHDQPVLNYAFDGRWARVKSWRPAKATAACKALPQTPDAFHFFRSSAPWSPGCEACAARNRACTRRRHGLQPCALPLLREAQRRWWAEVQRLPAEARALAPR
eukprot:CAMPEP_0119266374 /NCGR_PEP_ID=MMETSP1329-20130426/4887_1 /TAXON_ID=114041 /ORGANISM="Genus nov. species nov., Strain RCC1024" /LENGTH=278 /DNA_ID=CAMNT_0007266249 /DNA_START=119 /DNA_END=951 /DNA_ORIENTATION=-